MLVLLFAAPALLVLCAAGWFCEWAERRYYHDLLD